MAIVVLPMGLNVQPVRGQLWHCKNTDNKTPTSHFQLLHKTKLLKDVALEHSSNSAQVPQLLLLSIKCSAHKVTLFSILRSTKERFSMCKQFAAIIAVYKWSLMTSTIVNNATMIRILNVSQETSKINKRLLKVASKTSHLPTFLIKNERK